MRPDSARVHLFQQPWNPGRYLQIVYPALRTLATADGPIVSQHVEVDV